MFDGGQHQVRVIAVMLHQRYTQNVHGSGWRRRRCAVPAFSFSDASGGHAPLAAVCPPCNRDWFRNA
jgi:hypothetical protein